MENLVDISENNLLTYYPSVFKLLLYDHTTKRNIFWGTDSYTSKGEGYFPNEEITIEKITGENGLTIRPRTAKTREEQNQRVRDNAEVFTPSWVCNAQNNLVDEAWFGRKDVFNHEQNKNGKHCWQATEGNILFPENNREKTWQRYVRENVLEMTCGEAPYLVSRYDVVSGRPIPLNERIGLLDRKLRVVSENTSTSRKWLRMAQKAFMSTYGFEFQGDNLLLAREALFFTFIDYFTAKFGRMPKKVSMNYIAYIISWNLWQMDGIKGVVPYSCSNGVKITEKGIFGMQEKTVFCEGCQKDNIHKHNGKYCIIRDWGKKDPKTKENNRRIRFVDIIKN